MSNRTVALKISWKSNIESIESLEDHHENLLTSFPDLEITWNMKFMSGKKFEIFVQAATRLTCKWNQPAKSPVLGTLFYQIWQKGGKSTVKPL